MGDFPKSGHIIIASPKFLQFGYITKHSQKLQAYYHTGIKGYANLIFKVNFFEVFVFFENCIITLDIDTN